MIRYHKGEGVNVKLGGRSKFDLIDIVKSYSEKSAKLNQCFPKCILFLILGPNGVGKRYHP